MESLGVDRGDGKRPSGIIVFPFANRRSLRWKATSIDTFAETNIYSSIVSVGHEVREAEERKFRKYGELEVRFRVSRSQRSYLRLVDVIQRQRGKVRRPFN